MELNKYHRGLRYQRGNGIFGFMRGLTRSLTPILKTSGKILNKVVKSDIAKNVGKELRQLAKESVSDVAIDALEGKDLKDSIKGQLKKSKKRIARTIKKNQQSKANRSKRRKINDFDLLKA